MKIWHISDTHGYHELLNIPEGVDTVIFSGDCANYPDRIKNEHEVRTFLIWFNQLNIENKIMIAGNHDCSFENKLVTGVECLRDYGVHYLEDELLVIDGVTFYGSPWTPNFGRWSFMKSRAKINKVWNNVPKEQIDVLITHGPPKGILDISEDRNRNIEFCGDSALYKAVTKHIKPFIHCFGHIHNYKDHVNAATMKLSETDIWFSNGSVVTDGNFGTLSSNGNLLTINKT